MSLACRALYLEMLCEQWEHGSVPATAEECAAQLGGDLHAWRDAWPKLIDCFVPRKRDGRLINRKLDALRRERLDYLQTQRDNGRRGGKRTQQKAKAATSTSSEPQGSLEPPLSPDRIGSDRTGSDRTRSDRIERIGSNGTEGSHTRRTARARETNGRDPLRATFEQFWSVYPKKVGKAAAFTAWRKVHPTSDLVAKILAALDWQRTQDSWLRNGGQYIPNPSKYINEARWDDEPVTTPHMSDETLTLARATQGFLDEEQS